MLSFSPLTLCFRISATRSGSEEAHAPEVRIRRVVAVGVAVVVDVGKVDRVRGPR